VRRRSRGASKSGVSKSAYRRSTPVIRLRRNVDKIERHAVLCQDRLEVWRSSGDGRVEAALRAVTGVKERVVELLGLVDALERDDFVPPRRMLPWRPSKGDRVKVATEHRGRYEDAYAKVLRSDPNLLDELVVVDLLSSREILVQRGRRTPFIVRKSHVVRLSEESA